MHEAAGDEEVLSGNKVLSAGDGVLWLGKTGDRVSISEAAGNEELLSGDKVLPAGDKVLPSGDKVLPAGDKTLPQASAVDDKVLVVCDADDEVLWATDKAFPVRNEVLLAALAVDKDLVASETFFALFSIRCFSMLSTCSRYSGLLRFFPTFITSPGITSWCVRNNLRGRPLLLNRWSRCSPKTTKAYAISSWKAGCCAIFTS